MIREDCLSPGCLELHGPNAQLIVNREPSSQWRDGQMILCCHWMGEERHSLTELCFFLPASSVVVVLQTFPCYLFYSQPSSPQKPCLRVQEKRQKQPTSFPLGLYKFLDTNRSVRLHKAVAKIPVPKEAKGVYLTPPPSAAWWRALRHKFPLKEPLPKPIHNHSLCAYKCFSRLFEFHGSDDFPIPRSASAH